MKKEGSIHSIPIINFIICILSVYHVLGIVLETGNTIVVKTKKFPAVMRLTSSDFRLFT